MMLRRIVGGFLAAATSAAMLSAALVPAADATTTALPGLHRVMGSGNPGSAGYVGTTAECPDGTSVLGSGAELVGSRGQVSLMAYDQTPFSRSAFAWAEEDRDGTANPWTLNSFAICASVPERSRWIETGGFESWTEKAVTVTCPAGEVATGGGAFLDGGGPVVLDDVVPSADLTQVTATAFEGQGGRDDAWGMYVEALCGPALPGLQRVSATSPLDSATSKSVTAVCPAGKKVVGTGHEIGNGKGQVSPDDVVPAADLSSVRVEAFEDQDGTANNWSITGYAICADA